MFVMVNEIGMEGKAMLISFIAVIVEKAKLTDMLRVPYKGSLKDGFFICFKGLILYSSKKVS